MVIPEARFGLLCALIVRFGCGVTIDSAPKLREQRYSRTGVRDQANFYENFLSAH